MELSHRFTVPTPVEETWAHFADLAAVAECFPGAQLTSVEEDSFHGSVKVKLGPIALLYNGSGTFLERDDAAHRFVIEAKGKDKRGNGTAGATVTLAMAGSDAGTDVDVLTDLSITGKPAQFGRGVMQDVSDKLLGQFITCLETRLGAPAAEEPPAPETAAAAATPAPEATAATPEPAAPADSAATAAEPGPTPAPPSAASRPEPPRTAAADTGSDDAIDLGTTVLPVVAKAYWKPALATVIGIALLIWLIRRLR